MSTPQELSALPPWLQTVAASRGYEQLTAIQAAVLDPELAGRDLRVRSATGSGKTLAVAALLGQALEEAPETPPRGPRILLVAPTRELATQLHRELTALLVQLRCRLALVIGGGSYQAETSALRGKPEVLVATPGRLIDHMERGRVDLQDVAVVALDEADQLLELGFKDELDRILGACPETRRTLMSSATFGPGVLSLARRHQNDAVAVEGTPTGQPHADIEHLAHLIRRHEQASAVINLLLAAGEERSMVFVAMRAQVTELAQLLSARGFAVVGLSGEMSQAERGRALTAFRAGRAQVLVATDVAARGIDVDDVRLVIHGSAPRDVEALIHRSGRTGRAGKSGRSVLLLSPAEVGRARFLFERAGLSLRITPVPSAGEVTKLLDERLAAEITALDDTRDDGAARLVDTLLERFDARDLVERLITQARDSRACQPQRIEVVRPPQERGAERGRPGRMGGDAGRGGYETFELNYGRRGGATPQRVTAIVCAKGGIKSRDIGHIDVRDGSTHVEVRSSVASDFAREAAKPGARDRHIRIRRIAGPRQGDGGPRQGDGGPRGPSPRMDHSRPRYAPRKKRPQGPPRAGDRPPPRRGPKD